MKKRRRINMNTYSLNPEMFRNIQVFMFKRIVKKKWGWIQDYYSSTKNKVHSVNTLKEWYYIGLKYYRQGERIDININVYDCDAKTARFIDIYKFKRFHNLTWEWVQELFKFNADVFALNTLRSWHKKGLKLYKDKFE